jgi:hypothetical protein
MQPSALSDQCTSRIVIGPAADAVEPEIEQLELAIAETRRLVFPGRKTAATFSSSTGPTKKDGRRP